MQLKVLLFACVALSISLSAGAQKSNTDYLEDLKIAGYPLIKHISFLKTKKSTMTGLYRNEADKKGIFFEASILADKDGAKLTFTDYRPCVATDNTTRLQETIIMISGQKIEAFYGCGPKDSQNIAIFLIKSPAGNDFAKKEFSEKNYVFVHLNGLPVPFHTEGFSKVMEESSGKAL